MRLNGVRLFAAIVIGLGLLASVSLGAYLKNYPLTLAQPDGTTVEAFATGNEFHHWVHDENGYTILKNPASGFLVWAVRVAGRAVPSDYRVDLFDPQALGFEAWLLPPQRDGAASRHTIFQGSPVNPEEINAAPKKGAIHNMVIFIRFKDESEFEDGLWFYHDMFNADSNGANSLHRYFREASYDQLSIHTGFFPWPRRDLLMSYEDSHPRDYYRPYDPITNSDGYASSYEAALREQHLLKEAVDAVKGQVPASFNVDADGDGYVDNVCFIVKGEVDGWGDLLWPHMWTLYLESATINGARVWTFNFQLEDSLRRSGVAVLCHEMNHSLGAPDLYHYSFDRRWPVGPWDLMESPSNPPQHMGAYMKFKYGTWIDSIPEITSPGTYTLNPLTSQDGNCWKIRSPYSSTEFFVVEYRRKTGTYESSLPAEGLIVYRINTTRMGNAGGPPDEVYVYRPDGTLDNNGRVNEAPFSLNAGRTAINDSTNPSSFLSDGSPGGLRISNVSALGDSISFRVSF